MNAISVFLFAAVFIYSEVPHVANAVSPQGVPLNIKLVEDLRIGPDTHVDYGFWPGPYANVAVNDAGMMFVADDRENRIIVFNPDGSFLRVLGGFGQGPGEFQFLRRVQILADGRLVAFESQGRFSMSFFDTDLNFLEKITPQTDFIPWGYHLSPTGDLAWTNTGHDNNGTSILSTRILQPDGKTLQTIQSHEVMIFQQEQMMEPAFWAKFIGDQLKKHAHGRAGYGAFAPDGTLYTAVGNHYEITQWRKDGLAKVRTISRDWKPNRLSEAEVSALIHPVREKLKAQLPPVVAAVITPAVVEKAIEHAAFPPGRMPIYGLKTMEDGSLLVITDFNLHTRESTADLYDQEGRFRGSFVHPDLGLMGMVFKNGYAYTLETDQDEEKTLVRYRIQQETAQASPATPTSPTP